VLSLLVILTAAGGILARRNIRLGRGDRRGAFRFALAVATLSFVSWLLISHHVADPAQEIALVARGAGGAVLGAALLWLFYLALEPSVRRLRPWMLVSWARLLNGGIRDAVVGRDVLLGMAWGSGLTLVFALADWIPVWLGRAAPTPNPDFVEALLGTHYLVGGVAANVVDATVLGLGALLLFLLLRLLTRRDDVAAVLIVAILTTNQVARMSEGLWFSLPLGLLIFGSYAYLLLRFGVLAAIVGPFVINVLLSSYRTYALGSWVGAATLPSLAIILALGVFGLRTALGGHTGFLSYVVGDPNSSRPSSSSER